MARDIGPEMLANLDRRLNAGEITRAQYDARCIEVEHLIRTGRARDYSPVEKLVIRGSSAVLALIGVVVLVAIVGGGQPRGIVLGILLGGGALFAAYRGYRRIP